MMSKCFWIVMILSCSNATEDVSYNLEAPRLISVTSVEPRGLYIHWSNVRQLMRDPVLGFKIHIFEISESSETEVKILTNNHPEIVKNDIPLQKFNSNKIDPTVEIITGVRFKATVTDLKYNTLYEVRVLAFKRDMDGPLSEPIRIKILKDTEYDAVVTRTVNGCQFSMQTENVQIEEDVFPLIYNSYF
ncbi:uncharacterized protein LOC123694512 [Colias croceus]|uniref:uncharacterized protein LOC123694512 n=1 Tax=Colias crocea TaxID=72248 RepID=UPI001E27E79B|nr:uncharacterized protein LOC123694512 [Colias croceus]